MEATGRYHRLAFQSLHDAGFSVAVMNPYRTRRFADTVGQLAKTDHIDARTLARFATTITPRPSVPVSPSMMALGDLLTARRQVVQERATLLNQLGETSVPLVARQIRTRVKMCARHRDAIEREIRELISQCDALRQKFDILTSIPGVALITAATLLAELAELGEVTGSQASALVGVAPMNHDSGASRGQRRIKGGRKNLRKVIYMASLTAIKANPDMRKFYDRLKANGKPFKVALSAVMRKMVILANSLISENRCWSKTRLA